MFLYPICQQEKSIADYFSSDLAILSAWAKCFGAIVLRPSTSLRMRRISFAIKDLPLPERSRRSRRRLRRLLTVRGRTMWMQRDAGTHRLGVTRRNPLAFLGGSP